MPNSKKWIDLPGLQQLLKEEIPLAAQVLSEGRYPVIVRGTPRIGKSHIRDTIIQASKLTKLKEGIINCAAIPNDLAESILFGHKKGAFTGAGTDKAGLLFDDSKPSKVICLEEIGELPKHVQAKLLVFFDNGLIMPVGADWGDGEQSTLRVIATSNATDKDFREDLLARFWEVQVPPLHMRREDILYLLNHFLDKKISDLNNDELYYLMCHNWPGGVSEVEKVCLRIKSQLLNTKVVGRLDKVRQLISNLSHRKNWNAYLQFCHSINRQNDDFSISTLFPNFFIQYPAKKLQKPTPKSLQEEWEAWCYFFSQNPKSPNAINEEFEEKITASKQRFFHYSPIELIFSKDNLLHYRPYIQHFIKYLKNTKKCNNSGVKELVSFRQRAIAELLSWSRNDDEETDESFDLEPALESIEPKDYRIRFWQHQVLKSRTGSEVNKQYGIPRKTAETNVKDFKEEMERK